jgi:hypothetical protein
MAARTTAKITKKPAAKPTKTTAKRAPAKKAVAKKAAAKAPAKRAARPRKQVAKRGPNIPDWTVPSRPPRIYERAIIQPDPKRDDLTVGEAIPLMVLSGDRASAAAQRLCVFPLTLKHWVARGMNEVALMTTEEREEPAEGEAPYVWLMMGVMRAEAEWEHWAIEEWQQHTGKDWRAIYSLMKAKLPELYSDRVEVTGAGGGPVRVAAQIPDPAEVRAMLARDEAAMVEQQRTRELATSAIEVTEVAS